MELKDIKAVYFIGAGGIGMSALARYFIHKGLVVAGYDKTPSTLTQQLEKEGMVIHYKENVDEIPHACRDNKSCLVVYTPAIPADHQELQYFRNNGFEVQKRAQVLGMLTRSHKGLCVAGTHGKTTTSTMCAHIMHQSHVDCNAFLGGISKNYGTNYILSKTSDYVVIEADEFDRSFHWLRPWMSVITATDPDHLDTYGTHAHLVEAFHQFASQIDPAGTLIIKQGLTLQPDHPGHESGHEHEHHHGASIEGIPAATCNYTSHGIEADYYPWNVRQYNGNIFFDLRTPKGVFYDLELPNAALYNVENAVAVAAVAVTVGLNEYQIRHGFKTYAGVWRRFDYHIKTRDLVFIDDYAHHPQEIAACLDSIRFLYPGKRVVGIFQPHLYTRTRDFADQFAQVLSTLDELIMLPIYPAREKPLPGVTSSMVLRKIDSLSKYLCTPDQVLELVPALCPDVVVTMGAGDIDRLVPRLEEVLKSDNPSQA